MNPERQQAIELYISKYPSPVSEWLSELVLEIINLRNELSQSLLINAIAADPVWACNEIREQRKELERLRP